MSRDLEGTPIPKEARYIRYYNRISAKKVYYPKDIRPYSISKKYKNYRKYNKYFCVRVSTTNALQALRELITVRYLRN